MGTLRLSPTLYNISPISCRDYFCSSGTGCGQCTQWYIMYRGCVTPLSISMVRFELTTLEANCQTLTCRFFSLYTLALFFNIFFFSASSFYFLVLLFFLPFAWILIPQIFLASSSNCISFITYTRKICLSCNSFTNFSNSAISVLTFAKLGTWVPPRWRVRLSSKASNFLYTLMFVSSRLLSTQVFILIPSITPFSPRFSIF